MPRYTVKLNNKANLAPLRDKNRPDEVVGLLRAKERVNNERARNALEGPQWRNLQVLNDFWIDNTLLVEVEDIQTLDRLRRHDLVDDIYPEEQAEVLGFPNEDPALEEAAIEQSVTWGVGDVRANMVWDEFGIRGNGVRVGVVDTGIFHNHNALAGRLFTVNSADPNFPGGFIDLNNNGDYIKRTPWDGHNHGTHVIGTISGGVGGQGAAIGVAPQARIITARGLNENGSGTDARIRAALQYVLDPFDANNNPTNQRPVAVNNSWGWAGSTTGARADIVDAYEAAGVLFTSSTGNSGPNSGGDPGNYPTTFGVGAHQSNNVVADFSSGRIWNLSQFTNRPSHWPIRWRAPGISAPGVGVYSSVDGGGYSIYNGTSMANPHVCGVVALMKEANPSLTPAQIRRVLSATARWADYHRGEPELDIRLGSGRIDAYEAVKAVMV